MGNLLKQSSTAQPLMFLMIDSADHISPKTGLSPTVTLSRNGGAFAAPAGAVTEVGSGWYKVAGNATDTATLGPLILHATGAGADPVDKEFEVVAFDPQLASMGLVLAKTTNLTGLNDIAATAIVSGGAITTSSGAVSTVTTTTTATNVTTVNGLAAGVITAASIAADAITDAKVAADVTIASVTGAVGSVTGNVGGNVVGSVASVTAMVTANVTQLSGDATAADNAESFFDGTGYSGTNNVIPTVTTTTTATNVTTVNGLAAGVITAASIASNAITAAKVATDAIGAAQLAADAVTEIQAGLATAAALTIVDDFLDTEIAAIKSKTDNLPASPAAVGSNMGTVTSVTGAVGSVTAGVTLAAVTHTGAVIPTVTTLTGHTPQTGDSFARIGATGSGLTSLAPSATALSTSVWTGTKAGFLDAAITSRMATFTYTAPPSAADIWAIAGAEPTAVPGPTATFLEKFNWYVALATHETIVDADSITLRNWADTDDIATLAHAEAGGTYTRNKWTTAP